MQPNYRMRIDTNSVQDSGNELANALNNWLTKWGPDVLYKTCASCKYMSEGDASAYCKKFNMTPPARIILSGCSEHDDKEAIPF